MRVHLLIECISRWISCTVRTRGNNNHIFRLDHTSPDEGHDRMAELSFRGAVSAELSWSGRKTRNAATVTPGGQHKAHYVGNLALGAMPHQGFHWQQLVMRHPLYKAIMIGTIERAQVRASSFCVTVSRRGFKVYLKKGGNDDIIIPELVRTTVGSMRSCKFGNFLSILGR